MHETRGNEQMKQLANEAIGARVHVVNSIYSLVCVVSQAFYLIDMPLVVEHAIELY